MSKDSEEFKSPERRDFLTKSATLAAAATVAGAVSKSAEAATTRSGKVDVYNVSKLNPPSKSWPELGPVPMPKPENTAGPIRKGRGSDLTGKKAVVTGAARGIGRAIAVEYAANGADVAILDICGAVSPCADAAPAQMSELEETKRMIESYGRRAIALKVDIRSLKEQQEAAKKIMAAFGRIDILVCNAAIQGFKPILEMNDHDWDDQIENNLNGTSRTLRAFVPHMVPKKYGRVIILASMQGKHGTANGSSYSASKWGLIGLMKSAAMEFAQYNIRVNALLPGLIGTDLTINPERLAQVEIAAHGKVKKPLKAVDAWNDRAPHELIHSAWLQPEDISPMAVFLASDCAGVMTGGEYTVTGGDAASIS